jgi:hypothetical protein
MLLMARSLPLLAWGGLGRGEGGGGGVRGWVGGGHGRGMTAGTVAWQELCIDQRLREATCGRAGLVVGCGAVTRRPQGPAHLKACSCSQLLASHIRTVASLLQLITCKGGGPGG